MNSRWTKDERFIIEAYETVQALNDPEAVLDRYVIGQNCSLSQRAVDTICNLLAQANFIKKIGKTEMRLTKNGEALALRLKNEKTN